jgi:DNA-binding SARP family transcriptional activator
LVNESVCFAPQPLDSQRQWHTLDIHGGAPMCTAGIESVQGDSMSAAASFRVSLLDGFTILPSDQDAPAVPALPRGVQRLIAYLGLSRRVTRAAVAGQLWPDASEEHASGSLRSALWRVQKVAPGLVLACGDSLSLTSQAHVDVAELTGWARRAMDPAWPAEVSPMPGTAMELLPGWYEDWLLLERERVRQLVLHAWEAAAQKFTEAARYGEAAEAAYAAIRAEPLRESAHRTLMLVHLAEGNPVEAARVYGAFCTMLADEVGEVPSSRMRRLVLETGAWAPAAPLHLRTTASTPPARGSAVTGQPER